MRLVTFARQGEERLGALDGRGAVLDLAAAARELLGRSLPGSLLALIQAGESAWTLARQAEAAARARRAQSPALWVPLDEVSLRAPLPRPAKNVFCVGRNYRAHIIEGARARGREAVFPEVPEFFTKPPTSVIGPDEDVIVDARRTRQLDYEVELGVVVGARAKDLGAGEALSAVFGYTVINDVTARDVQKAHGQWFKGKGFDTFCPTGPCVVTADEFGRPDGHRLALRVNGEPRQDSSTADMLFSVPQILESLSASLTLEPGDLIATGTPSGVALGMTPQKWLRPGDVIEAEVQGIGVLRNRVRAASQIH
ncbi:MAG TPA: fumarylacetoacetate hydrolase family protein [Burkholderiales bacterium]